MLIMPIVVLFFQENGLSLQEVMILQGIYSFMVAVMEIPSGYLADVFGADIVSHHCFINQIPWPRGVGPVAQVSDLYEKTRM